MEPQARTPRAALPFAIVGATAGWVCADLFCHPFFRLAVLDLRLRASLAGALVGLLLSHFLTRSLRREERDPFAVRSASRVRLAMAMPAFGALAGLLLAVTTTDLVGVSAVGLGALGGVLAWPLCWLVLEAAHRAVRARHGSIVAASDRRAVGVYALASTAILAGVTAIDWPAVRMGLAQAPGIGVALIGLAGLGLFWLTLVDVAAFVQVRRAAASDEATTEARDEDGGEQVPRLDYGLGDDVRAEVAPGASAYRSRGRVMRLVLGAPDEALAALRRALVRNGVCMAVATAAFGAHVWGTTLDATLWFHDMRCHDGSHWDCAQSNTLRADPNQLQAPAMGADEAQMLVR